MKLEVGLAGGTLIVSCESCEDLRAFVGNAVYKINIRRYVASVSENTILFQPDMSYLAMKKVLESIEKASNIYGFNAVISQEVVSYINGREMYLDTRAKLGIEIKAHNEKLLAKYNGFAETVRPALERTLRERQMWDAFFMTLMKKSCNFSVPGSGKTSSVYGMFAFLRENGYAKRVLVICPKNAFAPWIDEFSACFGNKLALHVFNLHDMNYTSLAQKRSAIKYESGGCNLLLFNYESIKRYEREIESIIDEQTILVFDEVHKVKRLGGEYANSAIQIARAANYTIAMTGTPIPNTYMDLYNLLHILFYDEYEDFFGFQPATLRNPSSIDVQQINCKLQPFFCRTTKQQLMVPSPNTDSIIPVPSSQDEQRLMEILLKKYKKNKLLLMLRILQLESRPQLLLESINLADFQYILEDDLPADEIDYADYTEDLIHLINNCPTSMKMQQCINLVQGLVFQDKPVIIWCIFVDTIKTITNKLMSVGIPTKAVYGEIELSERQNVISSFKTRDFCVLVANPNTLAESVSLHTVCHDAVYFEYSFNLVHLLQSKDRIHRLGLDANQYTQYYFLQSMYKSAEGYYSMDEQIYQRLKEKETRMLSAIDAELLETMPTTQDELDLIFSQVIDPNPNMR